MDASDRCVMAYFRNKEQLYGWGLCSRDAKKLKIILESAWLYLCNYPNVSSVVEILCGDVY